jgi:hypothetical protein
MLLIHTTMSIYYRRRTVEYSASYSSYKYLIALYSHFSQKDNKLLTYHPLPLNMSAPAETMDSIAQKDEEVNRRDLVAGNRIKAELIAAQADVYVNPSKAVSTDTRKSVISIARTIITMHLRPLRMLAGNPARFVCIVLSTAEDHVKVTYTATFGGASVFPADALDKDMWYQLQPGEEIGDAAKQGKTVWVNLRQSYKIYQDKVRPTSVCNTPCADHFNLPFRFGVTPVASLLRL